MNERIKKLYIQTANETADGKEWAIGGMNNAERFAQLIVRECADIVEQAKKSPFVSLDDAKRMSHFVDVTKKKINKHFGVEE